MKKLLYTLMLVVPALVLGQSTNQNYVKSTTFNKEIREQATTITNPDGSTTVIKSISQATENDKIEQVTYYDGLGRPMQSVAHKAGGNGLDIVTHIAYDNIGRQVKTYLPYAATQSSTPLAYRTDALAATNTYYQTNYATDIDAVPNPFSEIKHEASPLNRVLEQAAPGKDWSLSSGHTIKFDYQTNILDEVRNYGVSFIDNDYKQPKLIYKGNYAANELYKTITKDENWVPTDSLNKTTEEFKDKLGRVILKRTYNNGIKHDTQYVYDKYGNLTYVLSPKGSDTVLTTNQYSDFNKNISPYDFIAPARYVPNFATGTASIVLNGRALTLNLNVQFASPISLDLGTIVQLPISVPNADFNTSGNLNGYNFKIENGYLTLSYIAPSNSRRRSYPEMSAITGTFTIQLPEYSVQQDVLDGLCYQYHYDKRNRLIEKKIPQKGWEYIVYDHLDKPTLTQDQNLKTQNKWLFTKYDAFGRVVYTGYYNSSQNRSALQSILNNRTGNHEVKETFNNAINNSNCYYSNKAFPNENIDLLTINYYDNYTFDTVLPLASTAIFDENITTETKGLATGSKVRVLGTTNWITTFTQYDKKARAIYIASKNEYLNTTDIVKTDYDFIGNVLKTESSHTYGSNAAIVTIDEFTYDHQNRLLTQIQKINNANPELLVSNLYDALGQLKEKKVGNSLASPLQNVNYSYNIRGWLKQINDVETLGNDLFSFKLNYNTVEGGLTGSTPKLYNGNIAQTIWKSSADNEKRSYAYNYDALNRITSGHTRKGASLTTDMKFDLYGVVYDKNGNILDLKRNGLTDAIDNLDYNYKYNQLTKVTDAITANTEGFKDGATDAVEYEYDINGNMTSDANKKITSIEYNHLNLPTKVTFRNNNASVTGAGTIEYVYDATGVKLKKVAKQAALSSGTSTFYAGNYVYKQATGQSATTLEFFNHPEGYVEPTSNPQRPFQYIYQYKDHLGNIRLSYADDDNDGKIDVLRGTTDVDGDGDLKNEIMENKAYYPFGLQHNYGASSPLSVISGRQHKYGFGGKEYQDELSLDWYDVSARNYDPALGRWMNIDPLAEDMRRHSPYNFGFDNPIYFQDYDGMAPSAPQDDYIFKKQSDGAYVFTGQIIKNDQPDRVILQDENGKESGRHTLNDQENDGKAIKDGYITTAHVVSEKSINNEANSVIKDKGDEGRYSYIERESRPHGSEAKLSDKTSTGRMDFTASSSLVKTGDLHIPEGSNTAFNDKDFGNFLWGHVGKKLGFSLGVLKVGAHANNFFNGATDNPGIEDTGILDSVDDQNAIKAGFYYPKRGSSPSIYSPNNAGMLKPWEFKL
ncbi:DUF6443 domain-containing protein [Pseudofulvibacter geojedonensis]|uniref:DUF6443 domain-containing protein n=1 Tax=Pseudofulvibacter geojedonensis TaxID=1123758 RepID=A0ABW3I0A3_9FLAO